MNAKARYTYRLRVGPAQAAKLQGVFTNGQWCSPMLVYPPHLPKLISTIWHLR